MPTARDIGRMALKRIGGLTAGETPSSEDDADVFERLNSMLDSWQIEKHTIYEIARVTYSLTANDEPITIGTSGDINRTRPEWIEHAGVVLDTSASNPIEVPIKVFESVAGFAAIRIKSATSTYPTALYFDRNFASSLATITLWPVQTGSAVQLVLYLSPPIPKFALPTTTYVLPGGYEEAIRDQLALRLVPEWGVGSDVNLAELKEQAQMALGRISSVGGMRETRSSSRPGHSSLLESHLA